MDRSGIKITLLLRSLRPPAGKLCLVLYQRNDPIIGTFAMQRKFAIDHNTKRTLMIRENRLYVRRRRPSWVPREDDLLSWSHGSHKEHHSPRSGNIVISYLQIFRLNNSLMLNLYLRILRYRWIYSTIGISQSTILNFILPHEAYRPMIYLKRSSGYRLVMIHIFLNMSCILHILWLVALVLI